MSIRLPFVGGYTLAGMQAEQFLPSFSEACRARSNPPESDRLRRPHVIHAWSGPLILNRPEFFSRCDRSAGTHPAEQIAPAPGGLLPGGMEVSTLY